MSIHNIKKTLFVFRNFITRLAIKMFLKPVWEGKMHGGTKIGVFRPLFCVGMLGKSPTTVLELGLSVALFEPNRTI